MHVDTVHGGFYLSLSLPMALHEESSYSVGLPGGVLPGSLCGSCEFWHPLRVLASSYYTVHGYPSSVGYACGILLHRPWLESSYPTLSMVTPVGSVWNPLILSLVTPVDPLILSMVVPGYPCGFCFRPCNRSQNGSHFMLALPADSSPMMRTSGSPVPRAHDVLFLFTLPARDLLILVTLASARTSGKMPTRPCAPDHT